MKVRFELKLWFSFVLLDVAFCVPSRAGHEMDLSHARDSSVSLSLFLSFEPADTTTFDSSTF